MNQETKTNNENVHKSKEEICVKKSRYGKQKLFLWIKQNFRIMESKKKKIGSNYQTFPKQEF